MESMILEALNKDKASIAKIISEIEKSNSLPYRKKLFNYLESNSTHNMGFTIGITGTPGAGKSSLIGELVKIFLQEKKDLSLAIIAIDPSSTTSGGSILGDRTRIVLPVREKRVFFRSQPSQLELGGLNPYTYPVLRFLRYIFDYVIVETVGIGQNEVAVSLISDLSMLVMQPLGGDQVQFMKSGIMEVPDLFVINKCDEETLANASYHLLESTLQFIEDLLPGVAKPPILKTSVVKKIGIQELFDCITIQRPFRDRDMEKRNQLEKWVMAEFGRKGIRYFRNLPEFSKQSSFEEIEEFLTTALS